MQHASAIHNGVDARKAGAPDLGRDIAIEIYGDRDDAGRLAPHCLGVAHGGNQVMSPGPQAGQEMAPDKAIGASEQNPHPSTLSGYGRMTIHRSRV